METTIGGGAYDNLTLGEIKLQAHEIKGAWNGDDAGAEEDRANIAEDIEEALKNLEELLSEL